MQETQVDSEHIASLYLSANNYETIEDYERDLEKLAKNVQEYTKEATWLDHNEYIPTISQRHLSAFKRAEQAIESITGMLASHVCHLLL